MIQKVSVPVSIITAFNHKTRTSLPKVILWEGQRHDVTKLGYHHTYREGKTLFHVFSVESQSLFFKLIFNTDNLSWIVEEIADGQPD